jgi:hypothetical protein
MGGDCRVHEMPEVHAWAFQSHLIRRTARNSAPALMAAYPPPRHFGKERTPEDWLFQVLVDWVMDLALPITEEDLKG